MTGRTRSVLLAFSIGANVMLAVAYIWSRHPAASWWGRSDRSSPVRDGSIAMPSQNSSGPATSAVRLWDALDTSDFREFVKRLRLAGFPERVIRGLVTFKVGEFYGRKRDELGGVSHDGPYWKGSNTRIDPRRQSQFSKLYQEERKTIAELIGKPDDLSDYEGMRPYYEAQYCKLPPEKLGAILQIQESLNEQLSKQFSDRKPGQESTPEERAKVGALLLEAESAKEKLLSPQELLEYKYRSSEAASLLRRDFKTFRPTEAEFKTLFPVYDAAMTARKNSANPTGPLAESDFRALVRPEVEALLGPERYADFVQATEPDATKLNIITERLGLPLSTAAQVTALQENITQRADAVRNAPAVPPDQKAALLSALAGEAESKIANSLGSVGFDAYKEYSGSWLTKLRSDPNTKK